MKNYLKHFKSCPLLWILIICLVFVFQACSPTPSMKKEIVAVAKDSVQSHRFFSETSFWNQPLAENPEIDPQSNHFIELMKKEPTGPFF
ncbi:MAG TPA: hypothetical protein VGK10_11780, partial [Prolixibacteraceae bacterium]